MLSKHITVYSSERQVSVNVDVVLVGLYLVQFMHC